MNINYIETKSGKKLFSFYRHDFKMEEGVGIDGGIDGYIRIIGNAVLKTDTIENLIEDIRSQFTWTTIYGKDKKRVPAHKNLLKDLDTNHILEILIFFTRPFDSESTISIVWKTIHIIFLEELKYRLGQQSAEDREKQEK